MGIGVSVGQGVSVAVGRGTLVGQGVSVAVGRGVLVGQGVESGDARAEGRASSNGPTQARPAVESTQKANTSTRMIGFPILLSLPGPA